MQKIGIFLLKNKEYFVYNYSEGAAERIDIFTDVNNYSPFNTESCDVSYIINGTAYIYGNKSLLSEFNKTRNEVSGLLFPEKQDISMESDGLHFIVTKEDPSGLYKYTKELLNGKLVKELFLAEDSSITYTNINESKYNPADKPINFDEYEELSVIKNTINKRISSDHYSYEDLLRMYPQVVHVLDNDYVVIRSYEEAIERLSIWKDSKEQLKSYDIESTGTDWGPLSQCRITGVFLGLGTTWSTYFPFRQDNFKYNLPIEFLKEIFDTINNQPKAPEVILLAHNVKFELQGFYQEFKDFIRFDYDTYLLSILANPKIGKGTHTLKTLTAKVDNKFYLSLKDIFIGPVQFNVLDEDTVKLYGCPDATSPAKIFPYLMDKIPKDEKFVVELEQKMPEIKAMNEFFGIRLLQDRLDNLLKIAEDDSELLSSIFKKAHRTNRNINSADVMRDIMYNQLRCPVKVYTNKGLPATSKAAIANAVKNGIKSDADDIIPMEDIISSDGKTVLVKGDDLSKNKYHSLIIYQKYKLLQKEVGALRRLKNKSVGGFFKFYINQSGAGSNRQTSDAHQFNDTMKSCAVADSEFHQLVSCDWKQVELRILAGLANQEDLMELEKDPSVDIHRAILSIIQKKPMWMVSEEDRQAGKSVNFGVVYMMSAYGLAAKDFGIGYTKEHVRIEEQKITDFFNGLPKIKKYLKGNEEFIKKNGYIKTAFNYYRYFPEILDPQVDGKTVSSCIRQGNNTPVQGTGAQMLKIVETKVWEYIKSRGWHKERDYGGISLPIARMILPIHDEILFSYDKTLIDMEEIIYMFKYCMELEFDDMPPFFAAPAFINNWYDGKNSAFEVDIEFRDKVVEAYENGVYLLKGKDYLQTLQDYRMGEIKEYLDDLITKYKTVDEVAKHVTHDNLTHVIIETQIPNKKERKSMTHLERIHEAVRRYMENIDVSKNTIVEAEDDNTDKVSYEEWVGDNECIEVDAYGDIVEQDTTEEVDEYYQDEFDYTEPEEVEECKVIYTLNECLIDCTDMSEEAFKAIQELCVKDAYYRLVLLRDNKIVDSGLNIGWIPEKLEDIIKEDLLNG